MGSANKHAPAGRRRGPPVDRPDRPIVLVVDDEPVNLMLASHMLQLLGIQPLLAADGAEAVALACEMPLNLILMDLQMPVLDGYDATVQIRHFERQHARARVPVVAYTCSDVSADHPRLRDLGIDAVLQKPGSVQEFQECVLRWCLPTGASAPGPSGVAPAPTPPAPYSAPGAGQEVPSSQAP